MKSLYGDNMLNVMLSNSQKKKLLREFGEIPMHKELQLMFQKMYPRDTSVYITHGRDEMGRDLIISKQDPTGTENIAVVVKMDKLSGSASDKSVHEVIMQINQCFQVPKAVEDQLKALKTDRCYVCIFGEISNKVQDNLDASLRAHEGRIKYFDIEKLIEYFTEYYPNIFLGASGLEALHNKYDELQKKILEKNKFLDTTYIEPNLRMFKKSKNQLLAISKSSDSKRVGKVIGDNIFGEKETIQSIAKKALESPKKMLIEGDAGSGKTVFVFKLTMHIIEETIHHINVGKNVTACIETPVVLKASKIKMDSSLDKIIEEYYEESTSCIKPSLLIIDGMDEVNNDIKDKIIQESEAFCKAQKITLIFTTRKSTEVKEKLPSYEKYELLPFETSQAINYVKKILAKNKTLLGALIKGLEHLKHQIPLYPMSLTLLIEIAESSKEVPASISELYRRYIEMALSQYSDQEKINVLFEPSIKSDFLECLSYKLFYKKNVSIIPYTKFDEFLDKYIEKFPHINCKESFLNDLKRTSVIKLDNHQVEFLHKSFLDYFIASYFKNRQTELYDDGSFSEIYQLYHTSLWEDVTYFYFGQKTRINQKEINMIMDSMPPEHNNLLKDVGQFMIGKLMQYAWCTDFQDKKYAIQLSISNTLSMRNGLAKLVQEELAMDLPKILGDIQMLHYIDEAFSSKFLAEETKSIIDDFFGGSIKSNPDLFYFATLYVLENANLLGDEYTNQFLNNFIEHSDKLEPELSVPLVNIMELFVKNKKLTTTDQQVVNIQNLTKKLKKRYSELTLDYLSFKSKLDHMKVRKLANNIK